MAWRYGLVAAALVCAGLARAAETPTAPEEYRAMARAILKEMVETNTVHANGSTGLAATLAARARAAGFAASDVTLLAPPDHPTKGNVVIRLKGKGLAKPVLVLAHLDVVEANPEDWSVDPFKLTEKDGYFYGRGTEDMKGEGALMLTTLIRFKREGFVPDRDIILALTADEEAGGDANGVQFLTTKHRDLVDAEYSINVDDEGGKSMGGKRLFIGIVTSEKLYATYELETTNAGGHSSLPRTDNAIYQLTDGLERLKAFGFPVHLTPTSRALYAALAKLDGLVRDAWRADMRKLLQDPPDQDAAQRLSADPLHNALLHTTCVPTLLKAGHGESALPQRAHATVQCRLIPGETPDAVQATLVKVLADPGIKVTVDLPIDPSPDTAPTPEALKRWQRAAAQMWPGVPVFPDMAVGASDSVYTREAGIPSYLSGAIFTDLDDRREHGKDERIAVAAFDEGLAYDDILLKSMAAKE